MSCLIIDADLLSLKTLHKIQDACAEDYVNTSNRLTKIRFNSAMEKIQHLIYLREHPEE
jgi:hypothetical protein